MDLGELVKLGVQVGAGGPAVWIACGVLIIGALILWYLANRAAARRQDEANRKQDAADQADGRQTGQAAENAANQGSQNIDEIRKENPDDGKPPRPEAP